MAFIPDKVLEKEELPICFGQWMRGVDIDPKIWPLVRILNLKGIKTAASCEGHYVIVHETYPLPWISLDFYQFMYDPKKVELVDRLRQVFVDYNTKNEIHWDVVQHDLSVGIEDYNMVKPVTFADIFSLQRTIPSVTKHIEDHL